MFFRTLWLCGVCLVFSLAWLCLIRSASGPGPAAHVIPLLPDHDCAMVCWNGIQPGVTDFKAARAAISENLNIVAAELDDRWQFSPDDSHIHTVRLEPGAQPTRTGKIFLYPDDVRLGEMLMALGEPEFLIVRFDVQARRLQGTRYIELYHPDYRLSVTVSLEEGDHLSPQTPVTSLEYFDTPLARPVYAQLWRGFASAIQPVYTLDEG
jgi:hypothetical protein